MSIIDNTDNYKILFNEYLSILSKHETFKFLCGDVFSRASFFTDTQMKTLILLIDNVQEDIDGFEILRRNLLLRQIDCDEFVQSVNELKTLLN